MFKKSFHPNMCMSCNSCRVACATAHSKTNNLYLALFENPRPVSRMYLKFRDGSLSFISCKHCEQAPCASSCPVNAIQKDPNTGNMHINNTVCRGCGICVKQCPYDALIQVCKTIYSCDNCISRYYSGGLPVCVESCPTGAITCEQRATGT